jgi:hypothetical protein
MLVEMAFALTVAAVFLELMLVYRYRILLDLFHRNVLLGIAFSMVLSWVLGSAFEASGMTVLVASVASTIVTAVVYRSGTLLAIEPLVALMHR